MQVKRLNFCDMWHLIKTRRYKTLTTDVTDELIISICWEESTFANIREIDTSGNDAVGFGQNNTRELWRLIGPLKAENATDPVSGQPVSRNEHVANVMLGDDGKCVELITRLMVEFGNRRTKILNAWSNTAPDIIAKWEACEKKLRLDDPYSPDWVTDSRGYRIPRRMIVLEGLNLARTGAKDVVGCVPER
jgi:hypothetical protein